MHIGHLLHFYEYVYRKMLTCVFVEPNFLPLLHIFALPVFTIDFWMLLIVCVFECFGSISRFLKKCLDFYENILNIVDLKSVCVFFSSSLKTDIQVQVHRFYIVQKKILMFDKLIFCFVCLLISSLRSRWIKFYWTCILLTIVTKLQISKYKFR